MQSDLDELKRSNSGFEIENMSLVKERNALKSANSETKFALEAKLATSV